MEDVSTLVASNTKRLLIPSRLPTSKRRSSAGYYQVGDPFFMGPCCGQAGGRPDRCKSLVAGCGTVQAAYVAFNNRGDEVVGIDLSEASLAHERFLQDKRPLEFETVQG